MGSPPAMLAMRPPARTEPATVEYVFIDPPISMIPNSTSTRIGRTRTVSTATAPRSPAPGRIGSEPLGGRERDPRGPDDHDEHRREDAEHHRHQHLHGRLHRLLLRRQPPRDAHVLGLVAEHR